MFVDFHSLLLIMVNAESAQISRTKYVYAVTQCSIPVGSIALAAKSVLQYSLNQLEGER